MSEKKKADIIIGGNIFTITGQDAAAKGDRIAKLVNETIYKVKTLQSSRSLGWDHVLTLALINLADELIAANDRQETVQETTVEVPAEDHRYEELLRKYKKLQTQMDDLYCDLMNLEQENMDLQEKLHEKN